MEDESLRNVFLWVLLTLYRLLHSFLGSVLPLPLLRSIWYAFLNLLKLLLYVLTKFACWLLDSVRERHSLLVPLPVSAFLLPETSVLLDVIFQGVSGRQHFLLTSRSHILQLLLFEATLLIFHLHHILLKPMSTNIQWIHTSLAMSFGSLSRPLPEEANLAACNFIVLPNMYFLNISNEKKLPDYLFIFI